MKRSARLQSARHWLATFKGKKIVHGYAKCFGVDLECALKELQMLGVELDPEYVQRVMVAILNRANARAAAAEPPDDIPEGYGIEWDDHHAYIAGFTSGGASFGVTWEQWDELEREWASCDAGEASPWQME